MPNGDKNMKRTPRFTISTAQKSQISDNLFIDQATLWTTFHLRISHESHQKKTSEMNKTYRKTYRKSIVPTKKKRTKFEVPQTHKDTKSHTQWTGENIEAHLLNHIISWER